MFYDYYYFFCYSYIIHLSTYMFFSACMFYCHSSNLSHCSQYQNVGEKDFVQYIISVVFFSSFRESNYTIYYILYVCVCVCFVICLFILLCIYIYMKVLAIYRCLLVKIDAFMCFVFVETFHQTKKVKQSKANFHFL